MQFLVRRRSRTPSRAPTQAANSTTSCSASWCAAPPPVVEQSAFVGAGVALPGLRRDLPSRRAQTRGARPDLSTAAAQAAALEELERDVYAASNKRAVKSRRATLASMLESWGLPLYPPTPDALTKLAASIKAGGFRSSSNLLSQYKVDAERLGHPFGGQLLRLFADVCRSCRRGQGPPVRAMALPLERLCELPPEPAAWARTGPIGPRNLTVIGSFWLMREAEVSGARAAMVCLSVGRVPVATLTLPASKSDSDAQGVSRSHACLCQEGAPRVDCPVHALWDQLWLLRRSFPARFSGDRPHVDLPLFPDWKGAAVSKQSVVTTLLSAARRLDVPWVSVDGSTRISGHTLRPTGAQGLTRLGLDLWAVQLLGRWGSHAVQQYIRDASSSVEAAVARRFVLGQSLRALTSDLAKGPPQAKSAEDREQ